MKKMNSRLILPSSTFILGLIWVVLGFSEYKWWTEKGPGSGFFPIIVGVILAGISVLAIINERHEEEPHYIIGHLYPLLAAVGIILAAMIIGFFPALIIFIFSWLRYFEKYNLRFSLLTSGITVMSLYGTFVLWLRVPFPMGIIYNAIIG